MKPWERFLEKYTAFGQTPTKESHAQLFAPDATIRHPGMVEPMPAEQYVDFIVQGLKRLPDFHLIPVQPPSSSTACRSAAISGAA